MMALICVLFFCKFKLLGNVPKDSVDNFNTFKRCERNRKKCK